MGDRADHYINQEIDGKAIAIAGIKLVSTEAQKYPNNEQEENVFGSIASCFNSRF
ncbi:hypothetical protein ONA21_02140 [Mycoplasmopsis cynos]|nr:hypothetical protein [Mycoplasmopsis cynos]WAM08118.1 hypothetical protein ONA21_02140 [Mycoplasmopsis cynos]